MSASESPRYLLANWKMHGTRQLVADWLAEIVPLIPAQAAANAVYIGLFPPFTLLPEAQTQLAAANREQLLLGAQNLNAAPNGALTGEVSADMLAETGCRMVLVGHSERRRQQAESDSEVAAKAVAAVRAGLRPVICVGETAAERRAGNTHKVLQQQMRAVAAAFEAPAAQPPLIAYEPVWAIGTGVAAEPDDIAAAHESIRQHAPGAVAVLYGGSVNGDNIGKILASPQVDGALVGGASLDGAEFAQMLRAALRG